MRLRTPPRPGLDRNGNGHSPPAPAARVARPFRPRRIASRAFYVAVLATLCGLGLDFAAESILFVKAQGVVDLGEIRLSAHVAGPITEILVEPGDGVRVGDLLAVVADTKQGVEADLARATAERLRSEIRGEREGALAAARMRSSEDASEAARLRDRALLAQADLDDLDEKLRALARQREELDQDLTGREQLALQDVEARASFLDLRLLRHDLEGQITGGTERAERLRENVRQLEAEAARLARYGRLALEDALASSNLPRLVSELEEAEARIRIHSAEGRFEVRAPSAGTISWVDHPVGEFVDPGEPILRLVPEEAPRIIAYAGNNVDAFAPGRDVSVRAAGLKARGVVLRGLRADREKPASLLKPYERAVVEPALLIRVDGILHGRLRAGTIVEVSRPRWGFLERLGL